jgi:hypothetical protein
LENASSNANKNNSEEGAYVTAELKKKLTNLGFVSVVRHEIKWSEFDTDKFVVSNTRFLADPIGVSHLDMINRALDLAQRAVRRILFESISLSSQNVDLIKKGIADLKASEINGRTIKILKKTRINYENKRDIFVYDLWKPSSQLTSITKESLFLLRNFNNLCDADNFNVEHIFKFIKYSPYFSDPRFVGEFLNSMKIFKWASKLIEIRDHASHNLNLQKSETLTKSSLETDLDILKNLLDDVAEKLKVTKFKEFKEVKIFYQFLEIFPQYFSWRKRQYFACSNLLSNHINVSQRFVEDLLDNKNSLSNTNEVDEDCSQQAMEDLLSHIIHVLPMPKSDSISTQSIQNEVHEDFQIKNVYDCLPLEEE